VVELEQTRIKTRLQDEGYTWVQIHCRHGQFEQTSECDVVCETCGLTLEQVNELFKLARSLDWMKEPYK